MPLIQAMHDAAKRVNPEILVLCHGGPIAEPEDAAVHPRSHRGRRRLLRRVVDGAAAGRGRDDRQHAPLQVDRNREVVAMAQVSSRRARTGLARRRPTASSRRRSARRTASAASPPSRRRSRRAGRTRSTRTPARKRSSSCSRAASSSGSRTRSRSSASATSQSSTPAWCTRPSTTATLPARILAVLSPCVGESGYARGRRQRRGALALAAYLTPPSAPRARGAGRTARAPHRSPARAAA